MRIFFDTLEVNLTIFYYIACVVAAAFFSWCIVWLLTKNAIGIGLVDCPNERSSHTRITPRGGGIGIVIAWTLGLLTLPLISGSSFHIDYGVAIYIAAALGVAGVSLWDDFRSIRVLIRIVCHLSCAVLAILGLGWFECVELGVVLPLGLIGVIVTAIWIIGLTNVYNFMDGIDGIAGSQGVVAGLAWCLVGHVFGFVQVAAIGALLAGACAGFLWHNWSPAKIFMGDVGSAFLGFVFGVLPLAVLRELSEENGHTISGRLPVFAVVIVWPFFADGVFTFIRRLLNREPVWKPHRSHLYQRMVQAGCSHSIVASYYCLWAIICATAGCYYLFNRIGFGVLVVCPVYFIFTLIFAALLESRMAIAKKSHRE